jgi:hypothetical protein
MERGDQVYHIGKVVKIYRKREKELGVQATVDMWDENVLTVEVDGKIAREIKEGSYVLVDYRPIPGMTVPAARQTVSRVLEDADVVGVWEAYKQQHERMKAAAKPITPSMGGIYR